MKPLTIEQKREVTAHMLATRKNTETFQVMDEDVIGCEGGYCVTAQIFITDDEVSEYLMEEDEDYAAYIQQAHRDEIAIDKEIARREEYAYD